MVQQTRAADAAQASALLSFNQSLIALVGSIIGFLTLVAAMLAAFYAKRAAEAAERSITHSRDIARQQLRAHLAIEREVATRSEEGKFSVSFIIKNVGATPARSLSIVIQWEFKYSNGGIYDIWGYRFITMTLAPGSNVECDRDFEIPTDESKAFDEEKGVVCATVQATFVDDFGETWGFRQGLSINRASVNGGKVYTDYCDHILIPDEAPAPAKRKPLFAGRGKCARGDTPQPEQ